MPPERDHGHLGRAAADVDDHVAGRLGDRQAGADRGGHRLLDQVGLARAGRERRLLDRALLDAGHAGRHADDDARMRPAILMDLLDEVPEHLLGHLEVGDDAVLEGPDGLDVARRAAQHALGLDADRVHLAGALVDRDDRWLGEHDAATAHVDERVGRAEVDGHVAAAERAEIVEDAHCGVAERGATRANAPGCRAILLLTRKPGDGARPASRRAARPGRPTTLKKHPSMFDTSAAPASWMA